MDWLEAPLTALAFLILVAYHVRLARTIRNRPLATSIGLANHLRELWIATVIRKNDGILAIQTLRNWTMAASFLASTAILIALGLINAAFATHPLDRIQQDLNIAASSSGTFGALRLLILSLDFFFTFFNFCLAIRHYNHMGFVINLPPEEAAVPVPAMATAVLQRASLHYTLGMRGYWLAVPLSFWLFGPFWLLLSTLVLTPFLHYLDHSI